MTQIADRTATAWRGFEPGAWRDRIDVRDFIQHNYSPHDGDASFLAPATERTQKVWDQLSDLMTQERATEGGVLYVDVHTPASITAHAPGYLETGRTS